MLTVLISLFKIVFLLFAQKGPVAQLVRAHP